MRPRTLLALTVVVAALGSFIWFYERELPSTDQRAEDSKRLLRLDEDSVRAIVLVSGDRRCRIERAPALGGANGERDARAGWLLTEPSHGRADVDEVESFLEGVSALEKLRELKDVSKNQLGLDRPRAQIELETESGRIVLRFGLEIPASSNTAVEIVGVEGEAEIYVVSDVLIDDIGREFDGWRSRDALPFDSSRVEKLEILQPSESVVLERSGEDFRLLQPIEDAADKTKVSALLAALVGLEIEEFLDDGSGRSFVSAPAVVRLTVTGVDEPIVVEVERQKAESDELPMIRVDGQTFEADTELAALLDQRPSEWRSTSWSDVEAYEIRAFRVARRDGEEQAFELREGEWHRGEKEVDYSKANAFLRAVTGAKGTPIEKDSGKTAEFPEIEIEIDTSEGRQALRFWRGADGDEAERSGRSARVRLDSESVAEFLGALEGLESEPEVEVDS